MGHITRFIETLKSKYNATVTFEDVGYESIELWHDEIDEYLVPADQLTMLPDPVQIETLSAIDESGIEWVLGVVQDEKTKEKLYEVWIRDGERIESILNEKLN